MDSTKKKKLFSEFALPNYNQVKKGFILERSNQEHIRLVKEHHLSVLRLSNEPFLTSECLFTPTNIGME